MKTTLGILLTVIGWLGVFFACIAIMSGWHQLAYENETATVIIAALVTLSIPCAVIAIGYKLRGHK